MHISVFFVRNLRSWNSGTWKKTDRKSSLCRTSGLWFTTSPNFTSTLIESISSLYRAQLELTLHSPWLDLRFTLTCPWDYLELTLGQLSTWHDITVPSMTLVSTCCVLVTARPHRVLFQSELDNRRVDSNHSARPHPVLLQSELT